METLGWVLKKHTKKHGRNKKKLPVKATARERSRTWSHLQHRRKHKTQYFHRENGGTLVTMPLTIHIKWVFIGQFRYILSPSIGYLHRFFCRKCGWAVYVFDLSFGQAFSATHHTETALAKLKHPYRFLRSENYQACHTPCQHHHTSLRTSSVLTIYLKLDKPMIYNPQSEDIQYTITCESCSNSVFHQWLFRFFANSDGVGYIFTEMTKMYVYILKYMQIYSNSYR